MGKNPSIDFLKGILILLVMGGHAMELAQQHHLAMWIGAGFRMPLMIGISGYLLNVPRTREGDIRDIARHYGMRMLLPWAVAMLVYLVATGWRPDITAPLNMVLRPPFHLWYIPVLFFLIMLVRLLPLSPRLLLLIGAPVSLATMYAFGLDHGPLGPGVLAVDSRYFRYLVYFFFGMLMARHPLARRERWIALTVMALGLFWWSGLQGTHNGLAFVPARLMMNLGLIALLPALAQARIHVAPVNRIGRDSLFFYLWHPLVMGLAMAMGLDAVTTLGLAVVALFAAGRAAGRSPSIRTLTGAVSEGRKAPVTLDSAVAPA